MSNLIHIDTQYKDWIANLSQRFKQSQTKAAIKVNGELLQFYWSNIIFPQVWGKLGKENLPQVGVNISAEETSSLNLFLKTSSLRFLQ